MRTQTLHPDCLARWDGATYCTTPDCHQPAPHETLVAMAGDSEVVVCAAGA